MSKIGIFVGSVYGNAQHVAEEVNTMLGAQGMNSEVFIDPTLNDFAQPQGRVIFRLIWSFLSKIYVNNFH
jgi:flavodoxin